MITLTADTLMDTIRGITKDVRFGIQWKLIVGDRASGKSTALVALYMAAREYGMNPQFVVPFVGFSDHIRRLGRHLFDADVYRTSFHTPRQMNHLRGHKVKVLLIDEWGMMNGKDHIHVIEDIGIHQPQFVFITQSTHRTDMIGPRTLYMIDVEPRREFEHVPQERHVHDEPNTPCGDGCPPAAYDKLMDYALNPIFVPITNQGATS